MVRPVVQHGLLNEPTAQVIDGSLRFNGLSGYLSDRLLRTPTSTGNRRKFTISTWIKFSKLNEGKWFGASNQALQIMSTGAFASYFGQSSSLQSTRLMRDPSAFYHCVCVVDTEQSDESSRIRMYINGEYLHEFSNTSYPSEDADTAVNHTNEHYIGISHDTTPDQEVGGYMSQYYLLDGMALAPGYFGFTDPATGAWKPKLLKQGDPTVNDGTTWSSGLSNSTGAANCFDGSLSTTYGPDGNTQTWTSPKPIQVHSQLRIFYSSGVASRQFTVNDNGNTINTGTGTKWVDLQFTGILTKIVGTNGWNCRAIEVDGVILTDDTTTTVDFGTNGFYLPFDGKTPIGEDQSGKGNDWEPEGFAGSNIPQFANGGLPILNTDASGGIANVGVRTDAFAISPNDGTTWSSNSVSTTGGTLSNAGDGFDGSLASSSAHCTLAPTNTSTTANVTFAAVIPDVTKVEVFVHSSSSSGDTRGTCEDSNGTTYTSATLTNAPQAFHTIYEGPPITLANVGWGVNQNGQTGTVSDAFRAFRVNGYVLKDSTSDEGLNLAVPFHTTTIKDVSHIVNPRSSQKSITESSTEASELESNFYGYSRQYNNSGDSVSVANSGDDMVLGTGDFTVECWVFDSNAHDGSNNRCYIWDNRVGGNVISGPIMLAYVDNHQEWNLEIGGNSLVWDMSPDYSTERNRWFHVAATRRAGTVTLWINGIARATATGNTSNFTSNGIGIGYADTSNYGWAGYIQDFRIYKGVCKYTKNFMVAQSKPDIMLDSPAGLTGSPKLTPAGGSADFGGADNDYLLIQPGSDFAFGTGDFTVECFVYSEERQTYDYIIDGRNSSQTSNTWSLSYGYAGGNGRLEFASGSSTILECPASHNPEDHKWHHIAVTRTGTTLRMFVDGIQVTNATNSTNFSTSPSTAYIGTRYSTEHSWEGYISNVHVVKGTCLYTTNFTPPTGKIKRVANTVLLCCQSDVSVGDATVSSNFDGTYLSGGTALAWDTSPIGNKWTLSNSNKTVSRSGGSEYTGGNVWSNLISANSTVAWTLEVTNGDTTGGWYFTDDQDATTTHPDELGGDSLGLRGGESSAGYHGDFASANGGDSGQSKITMGSDVSPNGNKKIDFVVYRPSSGTGKVWVKANAAATWIGGGNPTDTSSTATFNIPDSPIYFGFIGYSNLATVLTMSGDGDIIGPPVAASNSVDTSLFTPFTSDIDTCLGKETGHCTLNPIHTDCADSTFTHGGLRYIATNSSTGGGSIPVDSGKWYCEMVCTAKTATNAMIGVCTIDGFDGNRQPDESQLNGSGYTYVMNGTTNPGGNSYGANWAVDDVIGVALDLDSTQNTVTYYKNGVSQGAVNIDAGRYVFACGNGQGSSTVTYEVNFGQKPFKYAPPEGFQILNHANARPQTVITRPDQYVGVTTYTSDSGSALSIDSFNFQPDMIWGKDLDDNNNWHQFDSVRGPDRSLDTTGTGAESDWSSYFTRFDIRGFTVAAGNHDLNRSSNRMCAWGWKAGGAPTADNNNTSGAMDANSVSLDGFLQGAYTPSGSPSTYPKRMSIGTTQGFSIVEYVGNASNRTLPHGLGKAPKFMIVKNMETGSTGWAVYHDAIGHNSGDNYIEISDGQAGASNNAFQNTAPTADLFSIGTKAAVNNDTDDTIAWIWADVPGLQKFGSYKGNANTDGVFVELGFRPAIVMMKNTGSSINWYVYDSARDRYNVGGKRLFLNTTDNEATDEIDFVSNGFKWRDSGGGNSSSNVWLYAAWAAAPSINLYGALGEAR